VIGAIDEFAASVERQVRAHRGRWLVVEASGCAFRYTRKSAARSHIALLARLGIPARLVRYRRERVIYVGGCFEVTDLRWRPAPSYYPGGDLCIADDITECECARCLDDEARWERDQGWHSDGHDEDDPERDDEPERESQCTCARLATARVDHVGPSEWCGREIGP